MRTLLPLYGATLADSFALDGCISLFSCISLVRPYQPGGCTGQELGTALLPLLSVDVETLTFHSGESIEAPQPKANRKVATMQYIVAVSALYGRISLVADTAKNWEDKFRLQNLLEVLQV